MGWTSADKVPIGLREPALLREEEITPRVEDERFAPLIEVPTLVAEIPIQ